MSAGLMAWAGLGLFFVGLRLLGSQVQELGGGSLRALIVATLTKPLVPQFAGFLSGALTQSSSAVVFIASGLITGGVPLARMVPLLAWANMGTSALVLVASIDLRALAYYVFGAIGLAFLAGLDKRGSLWNVLLALLGLSLLLFGLTELKAGVALLHGNPWATEFFEFAGSEAVVAFLVGFVLAVPVQSSSMITLLALPLVQVGLLGLDQVVLMIYGAGIGSAVGVLLLASGMDDPARQPPMVQGLLRAMVCAVMLALHAIEVGLGVPLVMAGVSALAPSPVAATGLTFLAMQTVLVAIGTLWPDRIARIVQSGAPAAPGIDARTRTAYLFDEGVEDPQTALSLAALEQARLVGALAEYLEDLRPPAERPPGYLPLEARHAASTAIANAIGAFLSSTLDAHPGMTGVERLFDARSRLAALQSLQATLHAFATELGSVPPPQRPPLAAHMVEGLHAVLGVAADSAHEDDPASRAILATLTEERGALMDEVRKALLGSAAGTADPSDREAMLSATLLFERCLWMLRQAVLRPGDVPTRADQGLIAR